MAISRKTGYMTVWARLHVREPGVVMQDFHMSETSACVQGAVFDDNSNAVTGALVMANGGGGEYGTAAVPVGQTTVAGGSFSLDALPEGLVIVTVSARGFLDQIDKVNLSVGPCKHVDVRLQRADTINLLVKDHRGQPIVDAAFVGGVEIFRGNKQGRVELKVPEGTPPFECDIKARGFKAKTIMIDPMNAPKDVVLDDADTVMGIVMSESGNPIQHARVQPIMFPKNLPGTGGMIVDPQPQEATESDAEGRFAFAVNAPPLAEIRVTARGFSENHIEFSDADRVPSYLEIRMSPANAGIFGRVVDATGTPVKHLSVRMQDTAKKREGIYTRQFDTSDGLFSVDDIPAGTYDVTFRIPIGSVPQLRLEHVEIKEGYLYGEVLLQFSQYTEKK